MIKINGKYPKKLPSFEKSQLLRTIQYGGTPLIGKDVNDWIRPKIGPKIIGPKIQDLISSAKASGNPAGFMTVSEVKKK